MQLKFKQINFIQTLYPEQKKYWGNCKEKTIYLQEMMAFLFAINFFYKGGLFFDLLFYFCPCKLINLLQMASDIHTLSDSLLWKRFLEGDSSAYSQIYNQTVQELFRYGLLYTSDRELVKDCIHDVFVKIYTNRAKLTLLITLQLI